MKKSTKIRKKTSSDISIINHMKTYINKYSATVSFVRNIEFEEQADKDSMRFICRLDCGSFEQRIIYYPSMLFDEYVIDVEFSYDKSSYIYSFYDIFNSFDIDDFNLYFYKNLLSVEDVEHAVKEIFAATEKHFYYIKKAGTSEHIHELEKNYETDMNIVCGDDIWKEDGYDPYLLPLNHPFYSFADGPITAKMHKKLQKKNAKGKLDSLYEKRLLKHLDEGNNFERKSISEKIDFEKLYKRNTFLFNISLFFVLFVIILLSAFAAHSLIFRNADVYLDTIDIFGYVLKLPTYLITRSVLASSALGFCIITAFGEKIIVKIMPDDFKNRALDRYKNYMWKGIEKFGKTTKILISIAALILSLMLSFYAVEDVGYYDDRVRFITANSFKITDVSYEDLKIYRFRNNDKNGDGDNYGNAYVISDKSAEYYYELGELNPDGETQARLNKIAEQYNIEIIEIDSINDVSR